MNCGVRLIDSFYGKTNGLESRTFLLVQCRGYASLRRAYAHDSFCLCSTATNKFPPLRHISHEVFDV